MSPLLLTRSAMRDPGGKGEMFSMKMIAILFSATLCLQGCTYAISPGIADGADKTILLEYLLADPESFKGAIVIFGGTIAQTTAVDKGTLIEVIEKPLDYWGKPERTKKTGGRFFAFSPKPLNMMAYEPGVTITVAGEVLGAGSPVIGGKQYDYPVLLVKELKRWEREPRAQEKPQWLDPLYDPASSRRLE